MRIPKSWVPALAREIIANLLKKGFIELNAPEEQAKTAFEDLILDELMVEDRLNAEVKEILKRYESEIEKGRLDYHRLFELTKQKLVKERNLVL
ncbi:MAG: DUF507 family protein [Thermodesulfovibrionia bacterium]